MQVKTKSQVISYYVIKIYIKICIDTVSHYLTDFYIIVLPFYFNNLKNIYIFYNEIYFLNFLICLLKEKSTTTYFI